MIRFHGIHIAKIDPVCAAAEGAVMHHKRRTISDGLAIDAHTPISYEWHACPLSQKFVHLVLRKCPNRARAYVRFG